MINQNKKISNLEKQHINHINFFVGDIRNAELDKHKNQDSDLVKNYDIESLNSLQRISRLVSNSKTKLTNSQKETLVNLHNKDLHSAYKIASIPKNKFIKEYSSCFVSKNNKSAKKQAAKLHDRALSTKDRTVRNYIALKQHKDPFYNSSRFDNLSEATDSGANILPSYENIFGTLDFCTCPSERSITSQGAYFVDLMRIESSYIDSGRIINPRYSLISRRPDLDDLILSAKNTDKMISKVEIINNLLAIAAQIQDLSTGINNFEELTTKVYPLNLPCNLELEKTNKYLQQNDLSLAQIWQKLVVSPNSTQITNIYLQQLGFSPSQWSVYRRDLTAQNLPGYYGLDSIQNLNLIPTFIEQTKLSYDDLNELIYEDLSDSEIASSANYQGKFFINSANTTTPIAIDDTTNTLTNCGNNAKIFCNINMFIRMAKNLNWSFTELDWSLYTIANSVGQNLAPFKIDTPILQPLAFIKDLKDNNSLDINQICGFLNVIRDFGEKNGPNFFQQVYNAPTVHNSPFVDNNNNNIYTNNWTVPKLKDTAIDPAISDTNKSIQDSIQAATGLTSDELIKIGNKLLSAYPPTTAGVITLDLKCLSLIYRISLLKKITKLSLDELTTLYQITGEDSTNGFLYDFLKPGGASGANSISNLISRTQNIIKRANWLQENNVSVYLLQYWLTSKSDNVNIQNQIINQNIAQNFLQDLQNKISAISFDQSKFLDATKSVIDSIALNNSQDSIVENALWNDFVKNSTNGIITSIPTSEDVSVAVKALPTTSIKEVSSDELQNLSNSIISVFTHYQDLQNKTFFSELSSAYNIDPEDIKILAQINGLNLSTIIAETTISSDTLTRLQTIQLNANILSALKLSCLELTLLNDILPSSTNNSLTLADVDILYNFVEVKESFDDKYDRLLEYMTQSSTLDAESLAKITNWDLNQLSSLISVLWPNDATLKASFDNIYQLFTYFNLSNTINCEPTFLQQVINNIPTQPGFLYKTLTSISDQLWSGLLVQNKNNQESLDKIYESVLDNIRDKLLPLAIYELVNSDDSETPIVIENSRDLSEYFLIDVETQAIDKTSLIAEAIYAIQTYIYRCRNYLEEGVEVDEALDQIWPWVENYRLWQANREIFLYPENYIEPELRKNKTELFTKLQSNLQQGDLTDDSVIENSIRNYLDDLAKIANLDIVGVSTYSNYDNSDSENNSSKNLFIIGKTTDDEAKYYYLTANFVVDLNGNYSPANWGEWLEITCDIQAIGDVSPVFAFGKWYIFWIEQTKNSEDYTTNSDSQSKKTSYIVSTKYSKLSNSKKWSGKQTLPDTVSVPFYLDEGTLKTKTYPIYVNSTQSLHIPYSIFAMNGSNTKEVVNKISVISENDISNLFSVTYYFSYGKPSIPLEVPGVLGDNSFDYYMACDSLKNDKLKQMPTNLSGLAFSSWFCIDETASTGKNTNIVNCTNNNISNFSIAVNSSNSLCLIDKNNVITDLGEDISLGSWNHVAYNYPAAKSYSVESLNIGPHNAISNIVANGENLYVSWIGNNVIEFNSMSFDSTSNQYKKGAINGSYQLPATQNATILMQNWIYDGVPYIAYNDSDTSVTILKGSIDSNNNTTFSILANRTTTNEINRIRHFHSTFLDHSSSKGEFIAMSDIAKSGNNCNIYFTSITEVSYPAGKIALPENITILSLVDVVTFGGVFFLVQTSSTQLALLDFEPNTTGQGGMCLSSPRAYINIDSTASIDSISLRVSEDNQYLFIDMPSGETNQYISNYVAKKQNRQTVYNMNSNGTFIDNSQEIIFLNSGPILQNSILSLKEIDDESPIMFYSSASSNQLECIFINTKPKIFFNGLEVKNPAISTTISGSIAESDVINVIGQEYFPGAMQEILQFSAGLGDDDIKSLYNNSFNHINTAFYRYNSLKYSFLNQSAYSTVFIASQPNWSLLKSKNNTLLNIPGDNYSLKSIRINSKAVSTLESNLSIRGVDGLLDIESQLTKEASLLNLEPQSNVGLPSENIDFLSSPMSNYYWELFFFTPFYIARQLQNQQLFENSKKWFEYIFNPTVSSANWNITESESGGDKYWRFIGLRSLYNPTLSQELSEGFSDEIQDDMKNSQQLYEYHNDPFDPHAIARLRPIAYQKTIIMHYVGNIMSWADNLYRQDNQAAISEATMLYMIALDLLGEKPRDLGECKLPKALSYKELEADNKNNIPEFIIEIEQSNPAPQYGANNTPSNYIANSYFELPQNAQINDYWDQINQRLYNIRHSLNIDGIFEQIPLFAPAINPNALVEAISSGQSVEQALAGIKTSIPFYRFRTIIQKAKEVTNSVVQLGSQLLNALEKKDAEQLSRLYNLNEQNILSLTQSIKESELEIAKQNTKSLETSLKTAQDRFNFYSQLVSSGLSTKEHEQINLETSAIAFQSAAQPMKAFSAMAYLFPTIFGFSDGGMHPGDAASQGISMVEGTAQALNMTASSLASSASYDRRQQEWEFQRTVSQDEIKQIQLQIVGSKYHELVATQEINILQKNIDQQKSIYQYLNSKFTSKELYQWLSSQISSLYFQSYQLAHRLAMQAKESWIFEKGLSQTNQEIIQSNYWNSLKQGLTCGESLQSDLFRLEQSYMEQDSRRLEIEKTFQLSDATLFPNVFDNLKANKKCSFNISYDSLGYSSQYRLQIKTISLSFPALLGPYQNIRAILTQTSNKILTKDDATGYEYLQGKTTTIPSDNCIKFNAKANQQIALSKGIDDSGVISMNFQDDRYLPFEGTGVVSSWSLDMTSEDAQTISNINDVIIKITYTACQGNASS